MRPKPFHDRLLTLRTARELSQRALAAAAGITQASYQALETGRAEPRLSTLRALAKALKVSIAELVG
jgi:transcriptional regulator with XRE-family HTH domain